LGKTVGLIYDKQFLRGNIRMGKIKEWAEKKKTGG